MKREKMDLNRRCVFYKMIKAGALSFIAILISLIPRSVEAATVKQYTTYVQDNFVGNYGTMSTGTYTSKKSFMGTWLNKKGVLSVYTTDFNGDGEKECVVIYTKDYYDTGYTYKSLCIATLISQNGMIVKKQDFILDNKIDGNLGRDARIYVKTYKKKKYIVYQDFDILDGCGCKTYVFSMNSKGKLKLKLGLIDPGYTSALGLYKLPSSYAVDKLSSTGYWDAKEIYYSETWGVTSSSRYKKLIKSALSRYGLTIKVANTYFNEKHWLLKNNGNMKLLCSIKAKFTYANEKYNYTVSVKNNIKW